MAVLSGLVGLFKAPSIRTQLASTKFIFINKEKDNYEKVSYCASMITIHRCISSKLSPTLLMCNSHHY